MVDCIICLGGTPQNMRLRVEKAVSLYNSTLAKLILTGSSVGTKHMTEARFMKGLALAAGVDRHDIILEEKAKSTIGNALHSKRIMEQKGFVSAVVVTSSFHLRRSRYIFERILPYHELDFIAARNPEGSVTNLKRKLKEFLALQKLRIRGVRLEDA